MTLGNHQRFALLAGLLLALSSSSSSFGILPTASAWTPLSGYHRRSINSNLSLASTIDSDSSSEQQPAAVAEPKSDNDDKSSMNKGTSSFLPLAEKAKAYLTKSTDPFHAVYHAVEELKSFGFTKWTPSSETVPGGKYYYTVQQSTLVAFTVGEKEPTGTRAFKVIGGHTDSPNLRIKPRSKCSTNKFNAIQLGVECYGGGLWHTWFDRDLSLSGKVLVRHDKEDPSQISARLVQFSDPIARISNLAIHLQSADERKAFAVNKETHTVPIIASESLKPVLEEAAAEQINGKDGSDKKPDAWLSSQEPLLLQRIAQELDIDVSQIADWDLSFYDVQPAAIGGMQSEFLYSARLDNLATVFCSLTALAEHSKDLSNDADVSMICCFDHEEVGSVSSHGAGSPVLEEALRNVAMALGQYQKHPETIAKSYCLSIDQAHAVHPNYSAKHESSHGPTLNSGLVIKTNSNQRYTTNSLTGFILRELGRKIDVPMQEFVVRNDCPCGSTIGPTISARTGLRTIDAGMPQLSMHSCREVMGVVDLTHGCNLFKGFFAHFAEVDGCIDSDFI